MSFRNIVIKSYSAAIGFERIAAFIVSNDYSESIIINRCNNNIKISRALYHESGKSASFCSFIAAYNPAAAIPATIAEYFVCFILIPLFCNIAEQTKKLVV